MKHTTIQRLGILGVFSFAISIAVAAAAPTAGAQPARQFQGAGHNSTASGLKKVWTEDDLIRLRHAWDVYEDQEVKAWQDSLDAAAKASPAVPSPAPSKPATLTDNTPIPNTVEEIENKIQTVQAEIAHLTSDIENAKQSYEASTDDEGRARFKLNMEIAQQGLQDRNEDLKRLQSRLQELSGKQGESSAEAKQ
jgi:DNA repair exonuclease SbcCD ATPase subunit